MKSSHSSHRAAEGSNTLPVTTLLLDALTMEETSCYQDVCLAVKPLMDWSVLCMVGKSLHQFSSCA